MTDSTKTTNQTQSSTTNPWAPAQGLLTNLIGDYGSQNPSVTADQSGALSNLSSATQNLPNFTTAATGAVNNLFNSSNAPQVGMLNNAYTTLQGNLANAANPNNINPLTDPGIGDALAAVNKNITNSVKGVYAGSGRDPSGAGSFAGTLATGLAQGEAPIITSQYNTDRTNQQNAASALYNAGNTTASGISGLNQATLNNNIAGISAAGAIPTLATGNAGAQLSAADAAYQQPFANLSALLSPSTALAGLGSQSSGSGTSTQTSSPSLLDSLSSGTKLASSWLPGIGSALSFFSDARLKENIAHVGKLNDGQNVYSFNFKGDNKPQVGMLAQEVLQHEPSAVHQHPSGMLMVDYGKATHRARMMGKVGALREAA